MANIFQITSPDYLPASNQSRSIRVCDTFHDVKTLLKIMEFFFIDELKTLPGAKQTQAAASKTRDRFPQTEQE